MELTQAPDYTTAAPSGTPGSLVDAWRARVRREPDARAVVYFDQWLSVRELEEASDAFAAGLQSLGTQRGDRVGIYLQNIPQYVVSFLALWKLGATALVLNPMYRGQELRRIVDDAQAIGIICAHADVAEATRTLSEGTIRWVVGTSPQDFQGRDDPRVFAPGDASDRSAVHDVVELLAAFRDRPPADLAVSRDDIALLTYTSGTTGPPKGAMNTHGNLLAATSSFASCVDLRPGDVVFAMAPLFHITGAVINATLALLHDATLVMANRFDPDVALDLFVEHGVTFTIGSITAYNALSQLPHASREHFASVRCLYSGGAPIPPATVERFRDRFGHYIHNGYGMTETSSAVIAVPVGAEAPVDEVSGALSIGRPLPGVEVKVVDPDGDQVAAPVEGELLIRGPQVVPGYWRNPDATASTISGGWLHTGDGAIIDEAGWVYLVDRLKDQINTSGYKVWPREVEDVLCGHPAVLEAAVVGVPDEYRGEAVVAYVSFRPGESASEDELRAHVRAHLAAYKCPRQVHAVAELPKTQTGKIRRTALRS